MNLTLTRESQSISFKGVQDECRDCLSRLIDKTVLLSTQSREIRRTARSSALKILGENFSRDTIPAFLATRFQEEIKRITKNRDPFLDMKHEEMMKARSIEEYLAPFFGKTLRGLFYFSALGNALDFFRDPEEVREDGEKGISFAIDHLKYVEDLVGSRNVQILFLADNAGEIYFDMPVMRRLRNLGHRAIYVVKEGPAQNDLTMEDVKWAGFHKKDIPIISHNAGTVGIDMDRVSEDFLDVFNKSDLVIAKGMGHFETMSNHCFPNKVLYLLKAKCNPVAKSLGVKKDSFVALLK